MSLDFVNQKQKVWQNSRFDYSRFGKKNWCFWKASDSDNKLSRSVINTQESAEEKRRKESEELRRAGNAAFQNGAYQRAEEYYTSAILQWGQNHVLFNNRALARISQSPVNKKLINKLCGCLCTWTTIHLLSTSYIIKHNWIRYWFCCHQPFKLIKT